MVDVGPPEEPWNFGPFETTLCWVKTQDGREIPLRYTELKLDDGLRFVVEIWPKYPATIGQIVFRHKEPIK